MSARSPGDSGGPGPGPPPPPPGRPVFLARSSYRQRRLRDALRMLPVLGAVLWFVPLLWPRGEEATTSAALTYILAVWILLIALAMVLSRRLRSDPMVDQAGGADEEGG